MEGGAGRDHLDGWGGRDMADYARATRDLSIGLDWTEGFGVDRADEILWLEDACRADETCGWRTRGAAPATT